MELVYCVSQFSSLPSKAGVYRFVDGNRKVLYVGKANDLKSRVGSYFVKQNVLGKKTKVFVSLIKKVHITIVESELEALLLEAFYINKYKPKYNIRLTDNKSYVRIKITNKEIFPSITLARREEDKNAVYFGPYPSSSAVKRVLRAIRHIFPFVSVRNHPKKICLYHHLGLCPCPHVYNSKQSVKNYKKNIKNIIQIFEGKSQKLIRDFERKRNKLSDEEKYEEASEIQKKITSLLLITTPFYRPFEYDLNPNLRIDLREREMHELMQILYKNGLHLQSLSRIECYDISNLQGTNATGSMVVFKDGEKEVSQYRRFKIRRENKPNDYAMIEELIKRRLQHKEWESPNLMVVDGGKGQVTAGLAMLIACNQSIPLIGLAKKKETIIIPKFLLSNKNIENLDFIEVSLPGNSASLQLIMRIRDEAHRFAINYHKVLRSKSAIFSLSHTPTENKEKKRVHLR